MHLVELTATPAGDEAAKRAQADTPVAQEDAFGALVHQYGPVLSAFFYGKVRQPVDAEDLLQEVFLALHEAIQRGRTPRSPGAWMLSVARKKLNDYYRQLKRREAEVLPVHAVPPPAGEWTPETAAVHAQHGAVLQEVLGKLPEKLRIVTYLRLYEERNSAEIAQLLGEKEGTVRMRLARGLKAMRKGLSRRGVGPSH